MAGLRIPIEGHLLNHTKSEPHQGMRAPSCSSLLPAPSLSLLSVLWMRHRSSSLSKESPHLHILAEEERAHVRWGGSSMWFQQLACSHRLLIILLALPILQQGFEHVQAVVHSPRAQQGCRGGTGDEGGRLGGRR